MEISKHRMEINWVGGCARLCKAVHGCARMEISKHEMEINWVGGCARLCKAVHGCARLEMRVVHDVIDYYDITEVPVMSFEWFLLWWGVIMISLTAMTSLKFLWYHFWGSGFNYDIIDCYDITEVPMMSFLRFWLWLWYHRLLWHHWCSYDVICEALALMEVILISWRGEWVQLQ